MHMEGRGEGRGGGHSPQHEIYGKPKFSVEMKRKKKKGGINTRYLHEIPSNLELWEQDSIHYSLGKNEWGAEEAEEK